MFEEIKVADSVTTENDFVVNRVGEKPEKSGRSFDGWDMAIFPLSIGALASLGYLIYNVVKTVVSSGGINAINGVLGSIF